MRTLQSKYLSDIPIQEDNYKVDFIILEKYQNFSSEILRLALLGLTIYGFLITNFIFKVTDANQKFPFVKHFTSYKSILFLGALTLILTALTALGHRYFSTDCMTHFIRGLRLRRRLIDLNSVTTKDEVKINHLLTTIEQEEKSFQKDLSHCKWLLISSGFFLILGILLIVTALGCSFNELFTK